MYTNTKLSLNRPEKDPRRRGSQDRIRGTGTKDFDFVSMTGGKYADFTK
jgi:hypothetical protein